MKITINLPDEHLKALDIVSGQVGITKNGIIALAVWEWLKKNAPQLIQP